MKFCQARLSPPLLGQIVAEASIDASKEYMLMTYNEYVEYYAYKYASTQAMLLKKWILNLINS